MTSLTKVSKDVTSDQQVVPNLVTTWKKQCEHNLLTACMTHLLQVVRFLGVYTAKNATDLLQVVKFYRLVATCQNQARCNLAFAHLSQLVETTCSKPVDG